MEKGGGQNLVEKKECASETGVWICEKGEKMGERERGTFKYNWYPTGNRELALVHGSRIQPWYRRPGPVTLTMYESASHHTAKNLPDQQYTNQT